MSAVPQPHLELSVIVPAFNEEATLAAVVKKLLRLPAALEVIVVDDASTDRTSEIAAQLAARYPQVRVLRQPQNRGKSQAVIAGIARTRGGVVVIQDADTEYDSDEIPELIRPILDGVADAV